MKHEAIDFNANIANTDNFKLFKYKANFLGNTAAYGANEILKNINCCAINPIQDGLFWGCSRMGGGKKAPTL